MKNNKILKTLIIIAILLVLIILGVFLYDKYSDKTKIYQELFKRVNTDINSILNIENYIPSIDITNNKKMSLKLSKDNKNIMTVDFLSDQLNSLYQLNLNNEIYGYLEDNNLYFKINKLNDYYLFNFSEKDSGLAISNVGKTLTTILNNTKPTSYTNKELINDLLNILSSSLDNKMISKKRKLNKITNKWCFTSIYSYPVNQENLKKAIDNSNLWTKDALKELVDSLNIQKINLTKSSNTIKEVEIIIKDKTLSFDINANTISLQDKINYNEKENILSYHANDSLEITLSNNTVNILKDDIHLTINLVRANNNGSIRLDYNGTSYTLEYAFLNDYEVQKINITSFKNYNELTNEEQLNIQEQITNILNKEELKNLISLYESFIQK